MDSIAYALRAQYADDYLGCDLAVGDNSFNVLEALEKGNGQIVVDPNDHVLVLALDGHEPLKRVPVDVKKAEKAANKKEA